MEELLKELIKEIKALRHELSNRHVDTCDAKEACAIIGVNNHRYLNYFIRQNLLSRRKGGKGFLYYKSELTQLAEALNSKQIVLPSIKAIYGKK